MRTMKDLPATTRKVTDRPASRKAKPPKAKPEPITTWEGEGGALDPNSGSLADLGRQNQSELQPNSQK